MTKDPLEIPLVEYPRVVRGGSWQDDPALLRSAARVGSNEDWKQQDPQIPQSIWYFTDALHVGFRIVRPLAAPSQEEEAAKWDKSEPPQIDKKENGIAGSQEDRTKPRFPRCLGRRQVDELGIVNDPTRTQRAGSLLVGLVCLGLPEGCPSGRCSADC